METQDTKVEESGQAEVPDAIRDLPDAELPPRLRRAKRGEPDPEPRTGVEAVKAAAQGSRLTPEELADATAWFLGDEDLGARATKTFRLNVGANTERWVEWTVQAIERERIQQIRRMARSARARATGGGEVDEMKANAQIAAEGTVVPDLTEIAAQKGIQDAAKVLQIRLAHKPGLIDQIAGEVLTISGYDDEDIQEVQAVRG